MPSEINNSIIDLMKNHKDILNSLSENKLKTPPFYCPSQEGGFLGIGLNPSYDKDQIDRKLKGTGYEDVSFEWKDEFRDVDVQNHCEIEKLMMEGVENNQIKHHSYFKEFHELNNILKDKNLLKNNRFDHCDLLLFRNSTQKNIERDVLFNPNAYDFIKESLSITFKFIELKKPEIILIANRLGGRLFYNQFKKFIKPPIKVIDNKKYEYFILEIDNKRIPLILSGMLGAWHHMHKENFHELQEYMIRILESSTN